MEWHALDTYHLRCRYVYADLGIAVKFDLQLYKLENNSYLVDFKNVSTHQSGLAHGSNDSNSTNEVPHFVSLLKEKLGEQDEESINLEPWSRRRSSSSQGESVFSVYPFLDVCSKLINDIV
jgi:hypothetical protein